MYGLWYMKFIEDGDSSVHYNIIASVPYGKDVEKIRVCRQQLSTTTQDLPIYHQKQLQFLWFRQVDKA